MYEKSWTILMSYDIDSAGRMGVENNVPYLASCKGVGTNECFVPGWTKGDNFALLFNACQHSNADGQ